MNEDRANLRAASVECPYCSTALVPYSLHTCKQMQRRGWDRAAQIAGYVVAFLLLVYLTAHVLVLNGVACP